MNNVFIQEMIISSNFFLNNNRVDRVIKPSNFLNLAENIENVWVAKKKNIIPYSNSIYNVRDFNNWYFNTEKVKKQHPNTSIDVKSSFDQNSNKSKINKL